MQGNLGNLRVRLVLALFLLLGASHAMAAGSRKAPSLFEGLNCKASERATGCVAPYKRCALGVDEDIVATCKMSATAPSCSDFGWEKCCAANCYVRDGGKRSKQMGECIETCLAAPASKVYWPRRAVKK